MEQERHGPVYVCENRQAKDTAPAGALREFGSVGLQFPHKNGVQDSVKVRIGDADTLRMPDGSPLHTFEFRIPLMRVTVEGAEADDGLVRVQHRGAPDSVDVRFLQLTRDVGEMLLCHSFTQRGCQCERRTHRTPLIHTTTAQLLRHLHALEDPSLTVLVMLFIVGLSKTMLLSRSARSLRAASPQHGCVASAMRMGYTMLQHSTQRWGLCSGRCRGMFLSTMAALPQSLLAYWGEAFQEDVWVKAYDACTTRQGQAGVLPDVRFLDPVVPVSSHVFIKNVLHER